MASRYDENTKARAVRLVREHGGDYETEWAAMKAISARLGMSAETLRKWVRQAEVDAGEVAGVPTETAASYASYAVSAASLNQRSKSSRPQQVMWVIGVKSRFDRGGRGVRRRSVGVGFALSCGRRRVGLAGWGGTRWW